LFYRIGALSAALVAVAAGAFLASAGAEARHGAPEAGPAATSNLAAHQIQVRDFAYSPAAITNQVNDPITITVTNAGPAAHTFTITGLADSGSIPAGQTRTVQFTPTQAGDLTFFCTIHGQAVMSGRITVTGAATSSAPPAQQQPAQPPAQPPAVQQQPVQQPPVQQPAVVQPRPPSTGDAGLLPLLAD